MRVDPNKIRMTGENSFLRLGESENSDPIAQNSHWRVLISPKGIGHVLFTKSELTNDEIRIYSDNFALARWLQEGIQASMTPLYNGDDIPIIDAEFSQSGDTMTAWTEYIETESDSISLTWYDFREPFAVTSPPGENPDQPHGVYSVLVPARRAQMTINENTSRGKVLPRKIGDVDSSGSCLALSESWLIPRDHQWASS